LTTAHRKEENGKKKGLVKNLRRGREAFLKGRKEEATRWGSFTGGRGRLYRKKKDAGERGMDTAFWWGGGGGGKLGHQKSRLSGLNQKNIDQDGEVG